MATIILGQHPGRLEVRLTRGDSATLIATLADEAGAPTDWPAAPTLEFADGADQSGIVDHDATLAGEHATWALSAGQVEAIAAGSTLDHGDLRTLARITLPDGLDVTGSVEYAGVVSWSDGWTSSDRTQRVTFTTPGGPAGPGVPAGGTTGQALLKNSDADYDTEWSDVTGGPGGGVSSVNTRTGAVVLTSADVGLGNVNNTSDASKPVSTAQAAADTAVANAASTALSAHTGNTSNPHAVTKAQVGLGNVDNTADSVKPVSTAQAAADAAVQAAAVQRANHTGTQSADTLTDGTTNKAFTATERTKLAGVATGATANSSDATLLARANHTGTQSADTLTDGTTNRAFLATERTKLAGIATGATANSSDATLLARANHTGTQAISTVTGLQTALDGLAPIRSTINAQTGTTYTVVLSDENKMVTLINAGAITVTLPSDASVAIPVGGRVDFAVLGAGMATFVAGSGATANGTPSLVTRAQYSAASAIKVAANTWLVVGDLA